MRQFDVFRNPGAASARAIPYLLVLQADLLSDLPTRWVAPLVREAALGGLAATRLNPKFQVLDETVFMLTQQIGAIPARSLSKRVTNLETERHVIVGAVDFLLGGV